MTMIAPRIATPADGQDVPDKHAERIVWEMVRFLHAGMEQRWSLARGALNTSQMGNPVGQMRAVRRFAEMVGDFALRVRLTPAKRGRYQLMVVSWSAFDPTKKKTIAPGEPLPPNAQLAILVSHCEGKNHNPSWFVCAPLVISRHAMVRLATRRNVRTTRDLLLAVRELWDAAEKVMTKMMLDGVTAHPDMTPTDAANTYGDDWFAALPAAGLRLPLRGGGIAVLGAHEIGRTLIIKTILADDMD